MFIVILSTVAALAYVASVIYSYRMNRIYYRTKDDEPKLSNVISIFIPIFNLVDVNHARECIGLRSFGKVFFGVKEDDM